MHGFAHRFPRFVLAAVLLWGGTLGEPLAAQTAAAILPAAGGGGLDSGKPIAIVDVTLIPMDAERRVPGQTVVIEDGRITAIGPSGEVAIPTGTRRIDGRGRFLMPGLADMNVRLESPNDLILYLANGVTAVRNLGDPEVALRLRAQVERGTLPGPLVFTAGNTIDRTPASARDHVPALDAEEARRIVREQEAAGVDLVAVTTLLSPEQYAAVAREAAALGLPVGGDAPVQGGLAAAARGGQRSIDHLVNVLFVHFGRDLDPGRIPSAGEILRDAGISVTTAISAYDKAVAQLGNAAEMRRLMARSEVRFVSPRARGGWGPGNAYVSSAPSPYLSRARRFLAPLAAGLNRAGVHLVLGTDANTAGNVPGFAVHDELQALVEAGLEPYEALRAATVHAAALVGEEQEFGTVAVGRRADLLLLEADPLVDVANVARLAGVLVGGTWFSEPRLRSGLEKVAAGYPDPRNAMKYPFRIDEPESLAARRPPPDNPSR